MKAIQISQSGAPEVLQIAEYSIPTLRSGEVLIKVQAAGVNRPDVLQRKGVYPPPAGASDIPGLEIAGEIIAGDLSGSAFAIGDSVCALVTGGGYAEYCAAPLTQCLPMPSNFGCPWSVMTILNSPYCRRWPQIALMIGPNAILEGTVNYKFCWLLHLEINIKTAFLNERC